MDNGNEIIVTTSKAGEPKGEATKLECHTANGIVHWGFLLVLFDNNNHIYLAQRAKTKTLWPKIWDATIASHPHKEETIIDASVRRAQEELNIKVKPKYIGDFYYNARFNKHFSENEFCSVLAAKTNIEPVINPFEIGSIKTIKPDKLKSELAVNLKIYTPWFHITVKKYPDLFQ